MFYSNSLHSFPIYVHSSLHKMSTRVQGYIRVSNQMKSDQNRLHELKIGIEIRTGNLDWNYNWDQELGTGNWKLETWIGTKMGTGTRNLELEIRIGIRTGNLDWKYNWDWNWELGTGTKIGTRAGNKRK